MTLLQAMISPSLPPAGQLSQSAVVPTPPCGAGSAAFACLAVQGTAAGGSSRADGRHRAAGRAGQLEKLNYHPQHQPGRMSHIQFVVEALHVGAYRAQGDVQPGGDGGLGQAVEHAAKNIEFARGEPETVSHLSPSRFRKNR